ncbi:hypothetical protein PITC_059660 [Penicillium italicum]|uniref:Uncharacterized protein n=1 Tax=Penicillium italicum TaxID=40296 RepID=A0A0A2LGN6_PENIT|nr:hypothetical protein PITC_059660 [Penicillium italicum]
MSGLRDKAIKAFKRRLPVFYQQCRPLVDPLISLLSEQIYLDIGNIDLPLWRDQENNQQTELRRKIVGHLMNELRQVHDEEVQFDDDREDDIFTIVLYWYLKDNSAKFLQERQKARHHVWSTTLFLGFERRSPRSIAHTTERALEYCSPLAPVFIRRESPFAPNSFYGERDPQTGQLSQPWDYSDDESQPTDLENDTNDGSIADEKKSEIEGCFQEELSNMYLHYVEKPMKYDKRANLDDDSGDKSAEKDKSEIEMPSQEELLKRYFGRAQKQMKYGQRARPDVTLQEESILPEEPLRNLAEIPTKKVLTHVLERTNEKFHERYGNILSRIGMLSVQETLQEAFTPETRSLFSVLESGSIGLDENLVDTQKKMIAQESIFTLCGLGKENFGSTLANR